MTLKEHKKIKNFFSEKLLNEVTIYQGDNLLGEIARFGL
jgi:hypothetical protein